MKASPLQIVSETSAPYNAGARKMPTEIHTTTATSTFCMNVTDNAHMDHLRLAAKCKEMLGEPYSREAACISYMIDLDRYERGVRQTMPSQRDYARIWGWGRRQVQSRWEEILSTVGAWQTGFGRLKSRGPVGGQSGASRGPENARIVEKSTTQGPVGGQSGASRGPHTNTSYIPISTEEENTESEIPISDAGDPEKEEAPGRKKKRPRERKRLATERHVFLAKLLYELMLVNDPDSTKPKLEIWAEQIERLNRIDGRSCDEIERVIQWSQASPFWKGNILSAGSLRSKFPSLAIQSRNQPTPQRRPPTANGMQL